ncbi:unnamed protein product [Heterosigma akashiwo]
MIFLACIQSKCGVNALLKYPGPLTLGTFSHEGPSERVLRTAWVELRFFGSGYSVAGARAEGAAPDRQVEAYFRLPEAGYVATPIFVVTAAERILAGDTAVKARRGDHRHGLPRHRHAGPPPGAGNRGRGPERRAPPRRRRWQGRCGLLLLHREVESTAQGRARRQHKSRCGQERLVVVVGQQAAATHEVGRMVAKCIVASTKDLQ